MKRWETWKMALDVSSNEWNLTNEYKWKVLKSGIQPVGRYIPQFMASCSHFWYTPLVYLPVCQTWDDSQDLRCPFSNYWWQMCWGWIKYLDWTVPRRTNDFTLGFSRWPMSREIAARLPILGFKPRSLIIIPHSFLGRCAVGWRRNWSAPMWTKNVTICMRLWIRNQRCPLVMTNIAIENGDVWWENPL